MTTDAQFEHAKERVNRAMVWWKPTLGLMSWRIDVVFQRGHLERTDEQRRQGWVTTAEVDADWTREKAAMTFAAAALVDDSDADLEESVVHELCHALVKELRECGHEPDGRGHEERVVTKLTTAFITVRDRARKEAQQGLETSVTIGAEEQKEGSRWQLRRSTGLPRWTKRRARPSWT